jgi:hypothetical protein
LAKTVGAVGVDFQNQEAVNLQEIKGVDRG